MSRKHARHQQHNHLNHNSGTLKRKVKRCWCCVLVSTGEYWPNSSTDCNLMQSVAEQSIAVRNMTVIVIKGRKISGFCEATRKWVSVETGQQQEASDSPLIASHRQVIFFHLMYLQQGAHYQLWMFG